jgi:5-methyltetrahydropteroyltriglutamate--homocysteine methyltransferase
VRTSEGRFLTTHAGSLPRPRALAELHGRRSRGEPVDAEEFRRAVEEATASCIAAQQEAGIDVGNDGEQARESFFTYVQHRLTGFGGTSSRPVMRDLLDHPDVVELMAPRRARTQVDLLHAPAAIGEVTYRDTGEVEAECALVAGAPFTETFMTAASPGIVAAAMEDRHYPSRWRRRWPPSTTPSSTAASSSRSTPPTWPSSATPSSPTGPWPSSSPGSSSWSTP